MRLIDHEPVRSSLVGAQVLNFAKQFRGNLRPSVQSHAKKVHHNVLHPFQNRQDFICRRNAVCISQIDRGLKAFIIALGIEQTELVGCIRHSLQNPCNCHRFAAA